MKGTGVTLGIGVGAPSVGIHPYRLGHFVYRLYAWNRVIYPHPIPILGGSFISLPIIYPIAVLIPIYTPTLSITTTALIFTFSQCQCTQRIVLYLSKLLTSGMIR